MKNPGKDTYGFEDRSDLIIKVNYSASLIAAVLGIIGFFFLDIRGVIPYTFIVFAFLNFVNTLLYQGHKNLLATFLTATILRSEEHTSELQSRENLVCRLLLEKKKIQEI